MDIITARNMVRYMRRTVKLIRTNALTVTALPPPLSQSQGETVIGHLLSSIVLNALIAETLLKVISFRKTGQYRKTHDLLDLFNDLDDDTKNKINDLSAHRGFGPIKEILAEHKNDFIEFRYAWDYQSLQVDLSDLDKALDVLIEIESQ